VVSNDDLPAETVLAGLLPLCFESRSWRRRASAGTVVVRSRPRNSDHTRLQFPVGMTSTTALIWLVVAVALAVVTFGTVAALAYTWRRHVRDRAFDLEVAM
jgi:hypothetical protein